MLQITDKLVWYGLGLYARFLFAIETEYSLLELSMMQCVLSCPCLGEGVSGCACEGWVHVGVCWCARVGGCGCVGVRVCVCVCVCVCVQAGGGGGGRVGVLVNVENPPIRSCSVHHRGNIGFAHLLLRLNNFTYGFPNLSNLSFFSSTNFQNIHHTWIRSCPKPE